MMSIFAPVAIATAAMTVWTVAASWLGYALFSVFLG